MKITIYPVILPVPPAARELTPKQRVAFLRRHAREAFLSHKPATPSARKRAARIAANVIPTTLLLPNKIFNPIVLWIAVRIANEIVDMPIAEGEPDGIRFI